MINLIEKYSSLIDEIKSFSQVDGVIIFGSYSTNNIKPLSDLDIAILFKEGLSEDEKLEILSFSNKELDICDYSTLSLPIQFKIMTQGIVVKKSQDFNNLKINVMSKWLDFKPRLIRAYKRRGVNPKYLA